MEKKQKKKKLILIVLFFLLSITLAMGMYVAFQNHDSQPKDTLGVDENINVGQIEGLTEEEIKDNLNSMVEYNKVNINMNTSITVYQQEIQNLNLQNHANRYEGYTYDTKDNKGLHAVSCITNEDTSKICTTYNGKEIEVETYEKVILEKALKVRIVLDGESTPIYESGLVPYGSYLTTGKLNKDLAKGKYSATAEIYAYDEAKQVMGQSNVKVDLYVVDSKGNYE